MRALRSIPLLMAILALLGATATCSAAPLKIRLSYVVPTNWAPLIVAKKDLAKHWGKSYVMQADHFRGTPTMITAMANNNLEIADIAFSTFGLAIENAGISDFRVIADEFQDGVPGYYSNQFYVRKDSGINKIADLKGKVIATNAIGSGIDIAMKAVLRKHGLVATKDYTEIEAPLPAMDAILKEKKADLISSVLPFSLNPNLRKDGMVLFDQTAGLGRSQFVFWAARQSFINKHHAALVDFMEDVIRIERWYLNPKNHDAVTKLVSKLLKQPANRFGWLFTHKDYYHSPNAMPDLAALQRNVDTTAKLGFFKSSFNVKKYSDLSLVKDALKRLKPGLHG